MMEIETVEKANTLLSEIKELNKIEKMLQDRKRKDTVHFEVVLHYGRLSDHERVEIPVRYTERLHSEVKKIIEELSTELKNL